MLGDYQTHAILSGKITSEAASLDAYITNVPKLSAQWVVPLVNCGGRERHLIEDTFNTQNDNGIGLDHVFCANARGSKNYYTKMQVAQILWILTCKGCLQRLYDWALDEPPSRAWLAPSGRACGPLAYPPGLPPLGQIRFGFT